MIHHRSDFAVRDEVAVLLSDVVVSDLDSVTVKELGGERDYRGATLLALVTDGEATLGIVPEELEAQEAVIVEVQGDPVGVWVLVSEALQESNATGSDGNVLLGSPTRAYVDNLLVRHKI